MSAWAFWAWTWREGGGDNGLLFLLFFSSFMQSVDITNTVAVCWLHLVWNLLLPTTKVVFHRNPPLRSCACMFCHVGSAVFSMRMVYLRKRLSSRYRMGKTMSVSFVLFRFILFVKCFSSRRRWFVFRTVFPSCAYLLFYWPESASPKRRECKCLN